MVYRNLINQGLIIYSTDNFLQEIYMTLILFSEEIKTYLIDVFLLCYIFPLRKIYNIFDINTNICHV